MDALLATRPNLGPFLARLALGVVIFPHGAQKVLGWFGGPGFHGTLDAFAASGVPPVLTVLVMCAELLGSIGLVLGLLTRVAAAGVLAVMLGAIATVHAKNGFFMDWSGTGAGQGFEYHLLAIGLCASLIAEGAGVWSLDRVLMRRRARHRITVHHVPIES